MEAHCLTVELRRLKYKRLGRDCLGLSLCLLFLAFGLIDTFLVRVLLYVGTSCYVGVIAWELYDADKDARQSTE